MEQKYSFTPYNKLANMNRETFKILLMILMVLDHIYFFIPAYMADIFHLITRVVAVGFGYLIVEGLHYTHSKKDYLIRLCGFGALMGLGNYLLNLTLQDQYKLSIFGDNIFLTLALGAIIILLFERQNKLSRILAIVLLVFSIVPIFEGSFVVIPFMFLTELTYKNPKVRNRCYVGLALVLLILELPMALSGISDFNWFYIFDSIAMNASDVFFILIIPLLSLYNGKLGPNTQRLKYLFYIFYPAHLWIIHLLANYFQS